MEQTIRASDNIVRKENLIETVIMYAGIAVFSVLKIFFGTFKGILGFFIGLFGLYVYLGIIGVVLLWVLDAILHAIAGK